MSGTKDIKQQSKKLKKNLEKMKEQKPHSPPKIVNNGMIIIETT